MTDRIAIILNSLLYVLGKFENNTLDSHKLSKILYFADQKHLSRYGKDITGDQYAAMKYGPVPSCAFDIIKCAKGEEKWNESIISASENFDVTDYNVTGLSEPDMEWLSETDIMCLNESIEENRNLSFSQLTNKSHDLAWNAAIHDMDKKKIAEAGGANDSIIRFIESKEGLKNIYL